MQRDRIVAWVIRLILLLSTFALAAPVLVREIPEVRVNVLDEAEDAAATSQNSSDKLSGGRNVAE